MLKIIFELIGYGGEFGAFPESEKLYAAKDALHTDILQIGESWIIDFPFRITVQERADVPTLRLHCGIQAAEIYMQPVRLFMRDKPGVLLNILIVDKTPNHTEFLIRFPDIRFASSADKRALQARTGIVPIDPTWH
jgi:hypothetical protein